MQSCQNLREANSQSVQIAQVLMRHFSGMERFSELVYSKTNSSDTAKFLRELIKNTPYKVYSTQVDGGSAFMKNFEDVCH